MKLVVQRVKETRLEVDGQVISSIEKGLAIYVGVAGMKSMKKKNVWITFSILIGCCAAAYVADIIIPYNYMFLMRGDGTPYDIFYNLVGGNPVLYPLIVVGLFLVYIAAFYLVFFLIGKNKKK